MIPEQFGDRIRTDLENTADDILLYEHGRTDDPVEIAFYLHHYIYREVEYDDRHKTNRSIRDPMDCLDLGGNCEEQCLLLASLLASKDIWSQLVIMYGKDENHLSMRCNITRGDNKALKQIADLCEKTDTIDDYEKAMHVVTTTGGGWFSSSQRLRWYFADPELGAYLGDPSGLRSTNYITESGFDWKCEVEAYDPFEKRFLPE